MLLPEKTVRRISLLQGVGLAFQMVAILLGLACLVASVDKQHHSRPK